MRDKKPDIEREWISREERNMTTKKKEIPVFNTLEEERAYWDARGPLADGHKGTINKPRPKQKLTSFLAVRLTGEELTRLRDMAAKQGLGPSTYARILLTTTIKQSNPGIVDLSEIKDILEKLPAKVATRIYEKNKESNKYVSYTKKRGGRQKLNTYVTPKAP
jgi:hypothetical protein